MLSIAIFLAAGQVPVQLASLDEMRWQKFVRSSIASPEPARPARMDELAATVGKLRSDRAARRVGMRGPSGM